MKFCPFLVAGRDLVQEHHDHEQILETPDSLGIPAEELDDVPRDEAQATASGPTEGDTDAQASEHQASQAGSAASMECLGETCRFYESGDCRFDRLFAAGPNGTAGVPANVSADSGDGEQPSFGYVLQEVWSLQRESLRELIEGFRKVEDASSDKQGDLGKQLETLGTRIEEVRNAEPHPEIMRILESRFENLESCVGKLEGSLRGVLGESDSSLHSQFEETRQAVQAAVEGSRRALQETFADVVADVTKDARESVNDVVTASHTALRKDLGVVAEIRNEVGHVREAVDGTHAEIQSVHGTIQNMSGAVQGVSGAVQDVNGTVQGVHSAVQGVHGAMADMNGSLADVKAAMTHTQAAVSEVNTGVAGVRDSVQSVQQSTGAIHQATHDANQRAEVLDQRTKDMQAQSQLSHKKLLDVLQNVEGIQGGVREVHLGVHKVQEGIGAVHDGVQSSLERTLGKLHDGLLETRSALQEMLKNAGNESRAELERSLSRILEDNRQMRELRDQVERALDALRNDVQGVASAAAKLETSSVETQELLGEQRRHNADLQARETREEARRLNNAGVMSYHQGAYDTCIDQFRKALDMDPTLAEAWNNLGLALTEQSRDDDALEAFKKALEIDPNVGQIYNNLGYLYHRRGEFGEAVEMYERAAQRGADTSAAYSNLANALYQMDRVDDAVGAWKQALEIDPGNDKASTALERLGIGGD